MAPEFLSGFTAESIDGMRRADAEDAMAEQREILDGLDRCPHCRIATPCMVQRATWRTTGRRNERARTWVAYSCTSCGGALLTAVEEARGGTVTEMYPGDLVKSVPSDIPAPASEYLLQCQQSQHAPAGAVMLAASAVDAMLKAKGLKEGALYGRIGQATTSHLLTAEMAAWAHEVRLDANDQRHADDSAALPTEADARKALDFALALAEYLFVLPARVARGRTVSWSKG